MGTLPGYFTVTAPSDSPPVRIADLQALAGRDTQIDSETNPDDSITYALTRPVPFSKALSICECLRVSLNKCRWGDCRLDWSLIVDMPLKPDGMDVLQRIRDQWGGASRR